MFTQKGASQQGFLLLFLLFFPLSVARSCSKSQLGCCRQDLGLEELRAPADRECSGSLVQMLLTLLGLLLPCPSAWPPGLLLLSTGCLQGGVGLADFFELILNPPLASAGISPGA